MNIVFVSLVFLYANAFYIPRIYRSFTYNVNRSLPVPTTKELEEVPSSVNPDSVWDDGEVPWDIEDMKNITTQSMKMRPTPFSKTDYSFFAIMNGW